MELALSILIDELAVFEPVLRKALSTKTKFRQVHFLSTDLSERDDRILYLGDVADLYRPGTRLPANLIVIGAESPAVRLEGFDTLVQIAAGVDRETVMQKLFDIFASYQAWDQCLLTAIIDHLSINDFLGIAAEKLENPLALFDNAMTVMASAGNFAQSPVGTIWEKISLPGYPLLDFFTLQEQTELSLKMMKQMDEPYLYHPSFDPQHTYASTHTWVDGKLSGNIGLVDINKPFSEGQLQVLWHITRRLTQYFKTNDVYLRLAESSTGLINHLLEDSQIQDQNVAYHLGRFGWKRDDAFYLLSFIVPLELLSIIEANTYLKRIYNHYPGSMVSVYQDQIIMVIRQADYPIETPAQQQRLMALLEKYQLKCGISICFYDFLLLKLYFIQARYAVDIAIQNNAASFYFYAPYETEHLLDCLGSSVDLRVFCHPEILAIIKTADDLDRELLRNLHVYLLHGRNLSAASKALNLHRNTLIYRIDKIAHRLKLDFNELTENQLFSLIFSCIVAEGFERQDQGLGKGSGYRQK
ncbi:PucR family transcriptional regulator [Acetobacterium wieringae]|uniref:PucR family transcriptional regulator n=1 Tax=Acetobacterium wieringae TaxID=52694 RepID=A0A5D0WKQ6_9FIRM|nr:helix-turn-helix domain-containing protein [Acetobacterium wieringae]TYC84757.1 PucR family transcriptional regulator [Acetobacterium wieringae]